MSEGEIILAIVLIQMIGLVAGAVIFNLRVSKLEEQLEISQETAKDVQIEKKDHLLTADELTALVAKDLGGSKPST